MEDGRKKKGGLYLCGGMCGRSHGGRVAPGAAQINAGAVRVVRAGRHGRRATRRRRRAVNGQKGHARGHHHRRRRRFGRRVAKQGAARVRTVHAGAGHRREVATIGPTRRGPAVVQTAQGQARHRWRARGWGMAAAAAAAAAARATDHVGRKRGKALHDFSEAGVVLQGGRHCCGRWEALGRYRLRRPGGHGAQGCGPVCVGAEGLPIFNWFGPRLRRLANDSGGAGQVLRLLIRHGV